jgi:hypothetical protein
MRPLTEQETQTLFQKLAHYTGNSLKNLIAPLDDSPNADRYVFRIQKDRVYYVLLSIANLAVSLGKSHPLCIYIYPFNFPVLLFGWTFVSPTTASKGRGETEK